jgi:hypothetical protein
MKMLKLSMLFAVLTAFTFVPAPKTLEYKFQVGESYEFVQKMLQNTKQSVPGMGEMSINLKAETALLLKITEKTATGAKAEIVMLRLKVDTSTPMTGEVKLDSDGDQTSQLNRVLKSFCSVPFVAFIGKDGGVEKLEGLEKFQTAVDALSLDDAGKNAARQMAEQFAGRTTLKSQLENILTRYPNEKIDIGSTWKTSTAASMGVPIYVNHTWKLVGIEKQIASLESDGTVSSDAEKEFPLMGFKAKSNVTGRVASKAKANQQTGWPQEIKSILEMKGVITILAGGQIPENLEIPTESLLESEVTVTKK